jgi:hypothetical protein
MCDRERDGAERERMRASGVSDAMERAGDQEGELMIEAAVHELEI